MADFGEVFGESLKKNFFKTTFQNLEIRGRDENRFFQIEHETLKIIEVKF